jgi:hypothetical protein
MRLSCCVQWEGRQARSSSLQRGPWCLYATSQRSQSSFSSAHMTIYKLSYNDLAACFVGRDEHAAELRAWPWKKENYSKGYIYISWREVCMLLGPMELASFSLAWGLLPSPWTQEITRWLMWRWPGWTPLRNAKCLPSILGYMYVLCFIENTQLLHIARLANLELFNYGCNVQVKIPLCYSWMECSTVHQVSNNDSTVNWINMLLKKMVSKYHSMTMNLRERICCLVEWFLRPWFKLLRLI